MNHRSRPYAGIAGLTLAFTLSFAGGASAATTLGQAPPTGGTPAACSDDFEALQSSVGIGNAYDVPGPGVITTWMTNGHPPVAVEGGGTFTDNGDVAAFRVYRRVASSNTVTPIAESSTQTLSAGGPLAFTTRIPVTGGELIGIRVASGGPDGASVCLQSAGPDLNHVLEATPAGPLNQERAMNAGNQFRVDVGAVLEPDADGDGFGDETQDACPSDASTQGPCPPAVDSPETTITNGPKDNVKTKKKRAKATFEFSSNVAGATFECSLDGAPFAACSSPHTETVKKGTHTFAVRAKTPGGGVDASPATDYWKVKKKHKKN